MPSNAMPRRTSRTSSRSPFATDDAAAAGTAVGAADATAVMKPAGGYRRRIYVSNVYSPLDALPAAWSTTIANAASLDRVERLLRVRVLRVERQRSLILAARRVLLSLVLIGHAEHVVRKSRRRRRRIFRRRSEPVLRFTL